MSLYHDILGVSEASPLEEIKERYRVLCKQHHPDLNNDESIGTMALINEAYDSIVRKGKAKSTRAASPAGVEGIILHKDQAYAFYKQGLKYFNKADINLTFRDSNEWDKRTRVFGNTGNVDLFERHLFKSLYYFNIICTQYGDSEWYGDAIDKIKEINRRRIMIRNWRARFDPKSG